MAESAADGCGVAARTLWGEAGWITIDEHRESNAGDDFHFWWAASRALALIQPGTEGRLLTVEGLSHLDDPDDQYEVVDAGTTRGRTPSRWCRLTFRDSNSSSVWTRESAAVGLLVVEAMDRSCHKRPVTRVL